jgi:hypothetical protein
MIRVKNENQTKMKNLIIYVFSLLTLMCLFSCDTNKKLKQGNAEKAIKEFVSTNSFSDGGSSSFEVSAIVTIEPVNQFSEGEASSIVHFNYRDSYSNEDLVLKFIFKRNIDKHWILTSVERVAGVGSQNMSNKLSKWLNINILAQ